jgi:hypothetical protein
MWKFCRGPAVGTGPVSTIRRPVAVPLIRTFKYRNLRVNHAVEV